MGKNNLRYIGKYISMLYRASLIHINENLKEFNVTSSEYLYIINIPEDKGVNLTYLSKELYVDPALTTKVINNLVKKGFVEKTKCENDKRAYIVKLTEEGINVKPKILEVLEEWIDIITEGMDLEEKEEVLDNLEFMTRNIKKN